MQHFCGTSEAKCHVVRLSRFAFASAILRSVKHWLRGLC